MRMRSYRHMSPEERETLSLGLARGHSLRTMARVLGRAPSTVNRESARNTTRDRPYRACTAQTLAAATATPAAKLTKTKVIMISPQLLGQHLNSCTLTSVRCGSSWRYQDQGSNDRWLPFLGCPAVGDVLQELMQTRPHGHLTVCCGHTHNSGTAQILPNLEVITGAAENETPQVNAVIEVE